MTAPTVQSLDRAYDRRFNNFDVLRFVLATAVIWSHCYALGGRPMDPVFALSRQIDAGSLSVDGFFMLSGFLIAQSWCADARLGAFFTKRALRIVPALVVAQVFGAFVVGPLVTAVPVGRYVASPDTWLHFAGVAFHRFLASPLLFPTNPVPHQLNASLWSLRYEVLCYAMLGALGIAARRGGPATYLVALALALASYVGLLQADVDPMNPLVALARLSACFFAGSALFVYRARVPYHPALAGCAAAVLGATFLVGGFRQVVPLVGTYLLVYVACLPSIPLQRFARHGDFSYGLYVFAYPIQQSLVQHAGGRLAIPTFFALAFALTLACAVVSWHWVEQPALSLKPRRRAGAAGDALGASGPTGQGRAPWVAPARAKRWHGTTA